MPDDQDYADLRDFLADPERWSDGDAGRARRMRKHQASAAESFDQLDRTRVAAMWRVVQDLDDALASWERAG
jgi:hypothetical protein